LIFLFSLIMALMAIFSSLFIKEKRHHPFSDCHSG
jgi:hypothetical protein